MARLPWIVAALALGATGITATAPDPVPKNAYGVLGGPKLRQAYRSWVSEHERAGGDHSVRVGLGYYKGLSRNFSEASGGAELDLIGGRVSAQLSGLPRGDFELWIVDTRGGTGASLRPDPADLQLRVGSLQRQGERAELRAELGPRAFAELNVDLVVVAPAGAGPAEGLLYGSLPVFQQLYTALRSPALLASSGFRPEPRLWSLGTAFAQADELLVDPDVVLSQLVEDGADLFINETFNGNGRTCATCHPFASNTQLDVADIAVLPDSDPLFVAERSGPLQFNAGLDKFEAPVLMRGNALILENQDGFGDKANRFNMRGIPHTLGMTQSLAATLATPDPLLDNTDLAPFTSFPAQRTGWSGDGAPNAGSLRDFATGAVTQHFTLSLNRIENVDFRLPNSGELNAMEAFQLSLGRSAPTTPLANLQLLGSAAQAGRTVFTDGTRRCNGCHNNAGANNAAGRNRNFDTGVELRPNRPTEQILIAAGLDLTPGIPENRVPRDGGFGGTGNAALDGNGTGNGVDGFGNGTFNTPSLIEAADTAPFFHDNSAATLEDAIAHYTTAAFAGSTAGGGNAVVLSTTQINQISALLRVLNALDNIRAAREIASAIAQLPPNQRNKLGRPLLRQAAEEIDDALFVLESAPTSVAPLHPGAVDHLQDAADELDKPNPPTNPNKMQDLMEMLDDAKADMLG